MISSKKRILAENIRLNNADDRKKNICSTPGGRGLKSPKMDLCYFWLAPKVGLFLYKVIIASPTFHGKLLLPCPSIV